jgi:tripartite-type tricarboxylate transporter receptor subunit TctC
MSKRNGRAAILWAGAAMCLSWGTANADAVADFYKGRTVTITAATGAGSAYGIHGRLLAEEIARHIPGNPNVVMQFMPGGGGSKQANYTFNVAPKDGSFIGFPLKYVAVNQKLGRAGLKYDAAKFGYIGSLGPINSVVAIMKDKAPATTLEGVRNTEVIMGSTGKSSETFITPTLMNNLLGTRFKIVTGYRGMKDITLAMERGEVHGRAGSWESVKAGDAAWLKQKRVALIALSGLARNWDLPDLPTLIELARTPEEKAVLTFFGTGNAVGWLFITPPGVPAERLAALRAAFDKATSNPAYQARVKSRNLDIQPITGSEVRRLIDTTLAATPQTIARVKTAMGLQ